MSHGSHISSELIAGRNLMTVGKSFPSEREDLTRCQAVPTGEKLLEEL